MINCIGRSAHTLLGHAILILSFSFPTISHPPAHSPCWSWIANVSRENSAEHETLSLPTTLSRQFVQQVTRNSVSTTTVSCQVTQTWMMTRTDKDWHFVVDRSIKPFLSFRGHFSCGNSRISSNNKSYNLPFCEQLIALQMCINQNPASLTVLPDTSSTTWFKFSFISEYLVSCQIPPFRYDDTPPWWWWWWWWYRVIERDCEL